MRVKYYYTVRELSNHCAEIWALRQLGDEVYARPQCGDNNNCGGAAWLQAAIGAQVQRVVEESEVEERASDAACESLLESVQRAAAAAPVGLRRIARALRALDGFDEMLAVEDKRPKPTQRSDDFETVYAQAAEAHNSRVAGLLGKYVLRNQLSVPAMPASVLGAQQLAELQLAASSSVPAGS